MQHTNTIDTLELANKIEASLEVLYSVTPTDIDRDTLQQYILTIIQNFELLRS